LRNIEKELDKELVSFYGNEGKIGTFLNSVPNALQVNTFRNKNKDKITESDTDDVIITFYRF
jgi:hypothetical protein